MTTAKLPPYRLTLTPSGAPRHIFDTSGSDWHQDILYTSDIHFDSQHCNRKLLFKVLDEMVERNAYWIDGGDFWDAMQGNGDKRAERDGVRSEYLAPQADKRKGLWQRIVDDAGQLLKPYLPRLIQCGMGNHETAALKYNDINLTEELAKLAGRSGAPSTHVFGYTGYGHFTAEIKLKTKSKPPTSTITAFFTHGHGGGGIVTQGIMQGQRRMVYAPDAQLMLSGHIHQERQNTFAAVRSRPPKYTEELIERVDVVVPGMKQEYSLGPGPRSGWALERGMGPSPNGALWIRLSLQSPTRSGVAPQGKKALQYSLSWAK